MGDFLLLFLRNPCFQTRRVCCDRIRTPGETQGRIQGQTQGASAGFVDITGVSLYNCDGAGRLCFPAPGIYKMVRGQKQ